MNNEVTNKDNKKRIINIIIVIILCIVCLGIGYIIGNNRKEEVIEEKEIKLNNNDEKEKQEGVSNNKDKTEKQEDVSNNKDKIEKQENTEEKEEIVTRRKISDNNMNVIKEEIDKDEKITENIVLNGKTLELTYELENYDETWGGTPVFKINNNKIENKSLYGTYCYYIEYKKILGNDNKEYLLFTYGTYANYLFIINDEGRVIYSINSLDKTEECVAFFDYNGIGQRMYVIEDNNIYFYKAEGEVSYNSEANIELTEIKLIINNNMVKEERSSSKINGHFGQCK